MFTNRKSLGLAVGERGVTACLVGPASGQRAVLHMAAVEFTAELNLATPEKLGRELKKALRQGGISATRCVIGMAASYAVTREKMLPAADEAVLRGAIAIAAEREFASGDELMFDYCAWPSAKGVTALMAAAPVGVIDQVTAMARAAGLSPSAVTLTGVALAAGMAPAAGGRLVLCVQDGEAQLVVQLQEAIRAVRPLSAAAGAGPIDVSSLAQELKRTLASVGGEAPAQLALWDATASGGSLAALLKKQAGLALRACTLEADLGLSSGVGAAAGRFAPAASVALAGDKPTIDFLHSRLRPAKVRRVGPWARWAALAAAVAMGAALWFVLDWRQTDQDVLVMKERLDALAPSVHEANIMVDNISYARTWYDRRPEFLACMREITRAFPVEGRIWATSLLVHEDMTVLLTGQGATEAAVLDVRDKLKANPHLSNVKQIYIRQSDGSSHDVSFAISLSLRRAD